MKLELSQRRLFIKRVTTIRESKVSYLTSKYGTETEVTIPYEDLTNCIESHTISHVGFLISAGVLAFFAVISFILKNEKDTDPNIWQFWGLLSLATTSAYLISKENVWKIRLQNYTYIFLYKNIPHKSEVNDFIKALISQRNNYLRETYLYIDRNMSYESQINNLQWLRKTEVISKEEFERNREELNNTFNLEKKSIGFSRE